MATCAQGHESATDDYCDTCGTPIEAQREPTATLPAVEDPAPPVAACPACAEPMHGRYCESCGYDPEAGEPVAAAPTVTLALGADRAHWDRMVGSGEPAFPAALPALRFELSGDRVTLGRARPGATVDLALTGAAADPAVSHEQCVFEREGAGWVVRDAGSANGTWINDAGRPLPPDRTHPLADGDRVLMGAWTCLTVHVATPPSPT